MTSCAGLHLAPVGGRAATAPVMAASHHCSSSADVVWRGQVSMLTPLSPAQKSQLCSGLQPIHAKAGTMLIRKGELGDAFFIVEAGTCQVLGDNNQVPQPTRMYTACESSPSMVCIGPRSHDLIHAAAAIVICQAGQPHVAFWVR